MLAYVTKITPVMISGTLDNYKQIASTDTNIRNYEGYRYELSLDTRKQTECGISKQLKLERAMTYLGD